MPWSGSSWSQAYAVEVGFGERDPGSGPSDVQGRVPASEVREVAVMVTNRGSFTIMRVESRFCFGSVMYQDARYVRLSGSGEVRPELRGSFEPSAERLLRRVLTPLDIGIRFEADGVPRTWLAAGIRSSAGLTAGVTRWENKRGVVSRVQDDEPWEP